LKGFPCILEATQHSTEFSTAQLPRRQLLPAVPLQLIFWAGKRLVTATPTKQTETYLLRGCNTPQYEVHVSILKEFVVFVP
jgi:hypothetical protein